MINNSNNTIRIIISEPSLKAFLFHQVNRYIIFMLIVCIHIPLDTHVCHVANVQRADQSSMRFYLAWTDAFVQGFSNLGLIAINGSAVDVSIPSLQSPNHCLFNLTGRKRKHLKMNLSRHLAATKQWDGESVSTDGCFSLFITYSSNDLEVALFKSMCDCWRSTFTSTLLMVGSSNPATSRFRWRFTLLTYHRNPGCI